MSFANRIFETLNQNKQSQKCFSPLDLLDILQEYVTDAVSQYLKVHRKCITVRNMLNSKQHENALAEIEKSNVGNSNSYKNFVIPAQYGIHSLTVINMFKNKEDAGSKKINRPIIYSDVHQASDAALKSIHKLTCICLKLSLRSSSTYLSLFHFSDYFESTYHESDTLNYFFHVISLALQNGADLWSMINFDTTEIMLSQFENFSVKDAVKIADLLVCHNPPKNITRTILLKNVFIFLSQKENEDLEMIKRIIQFIDHIISNFDKLRNVILGQASEFLKTVVEAITSEEEKKEEIEFSYCEFYENEEHFGILYPYLMKIAEMLNLDTTVISGLYNSKYMLE